jgi:nucleoside-diphosphate-sugar epimerase
MHNGRMKKILITGGAGFLGRHLSRRYAEAGWRVTALDDLSSTNSSFQVPQLQHPSIQCVHGSTLDSAPLSALVEDHPVVVHFASPVGVGDTIDDPIETARNLTGTLHLVDALTPDHTVLFGSSADVYGMHSRLHGGAPMGEDDDVVFEHADVKRWIYPKIKSVEENVIAASPARSVTVRIFNCVGPGMDYPDAKRVVPRFLRAIELGEPLRLSGSGAQARSFSYYTDTLDGVERALAYAAAGAPGSAGAFNIGNDQPVSIAALAERMNRLAVELGVIARPLPILPGENLYTQPFRDDWDRVPALDRARRVLGFQPRVPLDDALRLTIASLLEPALSHA